MTAPHYVLERPHTGAWLVLLAPRCPQLYPQGSWRAADTDKDGMDWVVTGAFWVNTADRISLLVGPAWFTDLDARVHVWCEERRAARLARRETAARRIADRRVRHDA